MHKRCYHLPRGVYMKYLEIVVDINYQKLKRWYYLPRGTFNVAHKISHNFFNYVE